MIDVSPNRWRTDDPSERDDDKKINEDLSAREEVSQ
jgi:hypothetical protein